MDVLSEELQLKLKGLPLDAGGTRILSGHHTSMQLPSLGKRQRIDVPQHFVHLGIPEATINQ
jgi:hypothetical protein